MIILLVKLQKLTETMSNINQNQTKNQYFKQKKSTKVRNFDSYYNALTEHSAATSNIKSSSKLVFTTSKTINKNSSPFKKSSSGSKIPQPIPVNKQHNCMVVNNPAANGVSYGELQIIIQNIQSIKAKAKTQIEGLQQQNHRLFVQVQKYKGVLGEYVKFQEELKQKQESLQKLIIQKQNEFKKKEKQCKKMEEKLRVFQIQRKQFQVQKQRINKQIQSLKIQLQQQKSQKQAKIQEYDSLVNIITANQIQRINQLLWQIKNTYENQSILQTFAQYQKTILIQQKQKQALNSQIQQQRQRLEQYNSRIMQTQQILSQARDQNKRLISKVQQLQQKKDKILKQFENSLEEERKISFELKQANSKLHKCLYQKQIQFNDLKDHSQKYAKNSESKIEHIQRQLFLIKQTQATKQINDEYYRLVDLQCSQLKDYDNLLKRLQFLQKNKIQNRNNIQKVQYLCKMLDY